jgi:hypothetical protein
MCRNKKKWMSREYVNFAETLRKSVPNTGLVFMVQCIMVQFTKMTNKMQLCRIIYYSLAALHASSDIYAHHQEHLNCIYSFCYYSRMSLPGDVKAE